jgi:hypothetical protein
MKFLVELLQEALNLPDSVLRSRDIAEREPEMNLIALVVSPEQIDQWRANGVRVRHGISAAKERRKATLLFEIINGNKRRLLEATYSKKDDSSTIAVKAYGEELQRPVTTIADFTQILHELVEKRLVEQASSPVHSG